MYINVLSKRHSSNIDKNKLYVPCGRICTEQKLLMSYLESEGDNVRLNIDSARWGRDVASALFRD